MSRASVSLPRVLTVAGLAVAMLTLTAAEASAHKRRGFSGVVVFSAPLWPHYGYRPWWGPPAYPPPVVYAPPPVVYVQPAPIAATPASPPYVANGRTCREYRGTALVAGAPQTIYGTACLQPDGAWRIVR